ncbi:MAG: hypothetical protein V7640_3133 [Betaproteobacteria bacterium]
MRPAYDAARSRAGDEFRIALLLALEFQKIVITATRAVRIRATHCRPRLVHRAAAFILVEQHAGRVEHRVLAVAQQPYTPRCIHFGVACFGLRVVDMEMTGEAFDIAGCHFYFRVGAAIRGTFHAGVFDADRYRERLAVFHNSAD